MAMNIRYAGLSDQGRVRARNEDAWFGDSEQGLFIVSDGMGGRPAGDIASKLVVEVLPKALAKSLQPKDNLAKPEAGQWLKSIICKLSELIFQKSRNQFGLSGMGATLVMVLIHNQGALIGHLGDSRVYLFRDDRLQCLTRDHTIARYLVDMKEIRAEEAPHHPARGQITRFVGMAGEVLPEIRWLDLKNHDRLLLCSDGLTTMLPEPRIAELLLENDDHKTAALALVNAANAAGGKDNVTVLIVDLGRNAGKTNLVLTDSLAL